MSSETPRSETFADHVERLLDAGYNATRLTRACGLSLAEITGHLAAFRRPDLAAEVMLQGLSRPTRAALRRQARIEDVEFMLAGGENGVGIRRRLQVSEEALDRFLRRAGRDDLANAVAHADGRAPAPVSQAELHRMVASGAERPYSLVVRSAA